MKHCHSHLKLSDEVRAALEAGQPVIALESTIISHGMPYPQNVETARNCERIARENGAVPATCAIIGGTLCAGLTPEEIDYLGRSGRSSWPLCCCCQWPLQRLLAHKGLSHPGNEQILVGFIKPLLLA